MLLEGRTSLAMPTRQDHSTKHTGIFQVDIPTDVRRLIGPSNQRLGHESSLTVLEPRSVEAILQQDRTGFHLA